MSEIGDIYGRYHEALDHSLEAYAQERQNSLVLFQVLILG